MNFFFYLKPGWMRLTPLPVKIYFHRSIDDNNLRHSPEKERKGFHLEDSWLSAVKAKKDLRSWDNFWYLGQQREWQHDTFGLWNRKNHPSSKRYEEEQDQRAGTELDKVATDRTAEITISRVATVLRTYRGRRSPHGLTHLKLAPEAQQTLVS
jgi:hypothetical protein